MIYANLNFTDGEHASGGRHDIYVTRVNVSSIIIIINGIVVFTRL